MGVLVVGDNRQTDVNLHFSHPLNNTRRHVTVPCLLSGVQADIKTGWSADGERQSWDVTPI